MQFKISEVTVETINKGNRPYSIANVVYTFNGQARSHKVLSFSNPQVFDIVKGLSPGTLVEVDVTKNAQGYNQWAKVEIAGELPVTKAAAPAATNVQVKSNYETADERAKKQLMIVRQSSISNAIARAAQLENPAGVDIISLARDYVDFVYGNDEQFSLLDTPNSDFEGLSN